MNQVGDLLEKYQNIVLKGYDPVHEQGYTQIPNYLLKNPKLSNNAKVVYAKLLSYAWNNNFCFPGQETMAEEIGSSQSTVARAVSELEKEGWLKIERRGQGKTNIYEVTYRVDQGKNVDKHVDK